MEKINIAELLRDCPQGMELNCTIWENVTFEEVVTVKGFDDKKRVKIILSTRYSDGMKDEIILTEFGTYTDDETAKCVIFPKGKTTWEGFHRPFKDGDIVSTMNGIWIGIVKKPVNCSYETYITINGESLMYDNPIFCFERFATEEEKEKLFDAIKANGYRWNAKTKMLEKLPDPIFKIGQTLKLKGCPDKNMFWRVSDIKNYQYIFNTGRIIDVDEQHHYELIPDKWNDETKTLEKLPKFKVGDEVQGFGGILVTAPDNWEIVPDKSDISKPKPYFKVWDKIRHKNDKTIHTINYIYNDSYGLCDGHILFFKEQDQYELVPNKFDITTLNPFDKVLMRSSNAREWTGTIFSHYSNNKFYGCGMCCEQCIPYEGNEHLLGTTDDCDEFFKNWKS